MTLFGKFVQTKSANCFVILVTSWSSITEGYSLIDQANFLMFVFHKGFFSGCVQVVNGCLGVVAFEILFAGSDNFKSGSKCGVFEIFGGKILDGVFKQVESVNFFAFDYGFTDSELEVLI
jgi:hypothetical protein